MWTDLRSRRFAGRASLLVILALSSSVPASAASAPSHLRPPVEELRRPRTEAAITQVFHDRKYALAEVRASGRVPRIFVRDIPLDMASIEPVARKKALFIRILLPLVLAANEEIADQRRRLLALPAAGQRTAEEAAWLEALATAYSGSSGKISDLLERVDTVPPSLALAQGIDESGWGTSRFARKGESLFGQHAPKDSRRLDAAKAGGIGVAAFDGMPASVQGYFHNLNTGRAYHALRTMRARARAAEKFPAGADLAAALVAYSERGGAYVKELQSVIRANKLDAYDSVQLTAEGGSTLILPRQ